MRECGGVGCRQDQRNCRIQTKASAQSTCSSITILLSDTPVKYIRDTSSCILAFPSIPRLGLHVLVATALCCTIFWRSSMTIRMRILTFHLNIFPGYIGSAYFPPTFELYLLACQPSMPAGTLVDQEGEGSFEYAKVTTVRVSTSTEGA